MMGVRFHRQKKIGKNTRLNFSRSGVSVSQKSGVYTFNSRGTVSYNSSIKGLSFRMPYAAFLAFAPLRWCTKLTLRILRATFRGFFGLLASIARFTRRGVSQIRKRNSPNSTP